MKTKLIALTLFSVTAAVVAAYPAFETRDLERQVPTPDTNPVQPLLAQHRIDLVFALDTTSSMGGLIEAAKEKIWSITSNLAAAQPTPEIRIGLVAYRDRGDNYVTLVHDLSTDIDSVYATLMELQAAGGGDGPESVNQALDDALNKISWSQDTNTYKVIFLVGDAEPHMDYPNERRYPQILADARKRQIRINAIQCGQDDATRVSWREIARLGAGAYLQVDQSGSAVAISTPFDSKIAELSQALDETRLYYGSAAERAHLQSKLDAAKKLHAGASTASRARRAEYNLSASGETNFLGENELVDAVDSGRVALDNIENDTLPSSLRAMAPADRKRLIEQKAEQRKILRQEIGKLSHKRSEYLEQKVKELGNDEASLDHKIQSVVKAQATAEGLRYDDGAMHY